VHRVDAAATAATRTVDVTPRVDPLAGARRAAVWWAIAGTTLVLLAALAARVAGRRRRG
jgi:hypothetical protein